MRRAQSLRRAARLARSAVRMGPRRAARVISSRLLTPPSAHLSTPLVAPELIAAVDWTSPPAHLLQPPRVESGQVDVAWVTSPPSAGSGGHQNMFRFIKRLEEAGHRCTVYLYDWQGSHIDGPALKRMLAPISAYPDLDAEFLNYSGSVHDGAHAIFATAWETAYPVYADPSTARRFYFVQDFEPWFYPVGDNAVLAENTYRFGFHGLTAGSWLAHKLSSEFGMAADHYDFAADTELYTVTRREGRRGVFFYARPTTPRRAFDLGIASLAAFARERPDVPIHLAGGELPDGAVPFPHINHGSVGLDELGPLYNECSAALVLSLSNMSLLPLELLACGVTPVINDAPNNRMVSDNPQLAYVPLSPAVIARRLAELVDEPADPDALAASVASHSWHDSGRQFVTAFEEAMRG